VRKLQKLVKSQKEPELVRHDNGTLETKAGAYLSKGVFGGILTPIKCNTLFQLLAYDIV
jgi:hypothetical protein